MELFLSVTYHKYLYYYEVDQVKLVYSAFSRMSRKLPTTITNFFPHLKASVYQTCLQSESLLILLPTVAPPGKSLTTQ